MTEALIVVLFALVGVSADVLARLLHEHRGSGHGWTAANHVGAWHVVGGNEQLAVPMIGGMISSTVLTLLAIPAIDALVKESGLRKP